MKCLDPVLCYTNEKGKRIFRHWSLASDIYKSALHNQVFNCGRCIFCRKKKSVELAVRCVLHSSLYTKNCFLTLTYDEKKEGYHNNFQYEDIQKFKKRLRSFVSRKFDKKIEIFNVHEYGKNGKKHWHLIVFNYRPEDSQYFTTKNGNDYYTSEKLKKLWPFGHHTIGDVSEASAMYQAQYTQKDFQYDHAGTNKKSHSKHSGIGKQYFLNHYKQILSLGYVPFDGKKIPLPRYFEKLAHKHWAHFYDQSYFWDIPQRKKVYTPFKSGLENKDIADHYIIYKTLKNEKILELENEWRAVVDQYLDSHEKPDFIKSAENALYDLKNKNSKERF